MDLIIINCKLASTKRKRLH